MEHQQTSFGSIQELLPAAGETWYERNRQAREKVDAEVVQLKQRILDLQTDRNELAPISIFPTEILVDIFHRVVDDDHRRCRSQEDGEDEYAKAANDNNNSNGDGEDCGNPKSAALRRRTLVNLSAVCSKWRGVVVSCATLWAEVETQNAEWVALCLQRSRTAPLSLTIPYHSPTPMYMAACREMSFASPQVGHLGRLRRLEVRAVPQEKVVLVDLGLFAPAPALESLYLHGAYVPRMLFSGLAPRLRRLVLNGCLFETDLPLLRGVELEHLEISVPAQRLPMGDLLGIIQNSPQLGSLVLRSCVRISADDVPGYSDGKRISLERLNKLSLADDNPDAIFHFLDHLEFSVGTTIQLNFFDAEISALLLFRLFGEGINIQRFNSPDMRITALDLGRDESTFTLDAYSPTSITEKAVFVRVAHKRISQLLLALRGLPLNHLTTLSASQPLSVPYSLLAVRILDAFGALPSLKELVLRGASMKAYVEALHVDPRTFSGLVARGRRMPFPALASLVIYEPGLGQPQSLLEQLKLQVVLHNIARALRMRAQVGSRLDKVAFVALPTPALGLMYDFEGIKKEARVFEYRQGS